MAACFIINTMTFS